jgi:hypothetical protein
VPTVPEPASRHFATGTVGAHAYYPRSTPKGGCYQKGTHNPLAGGCVLGDKKRPGGIDLEPGDCDNNLTMKSLHASPISDLLKRTIIESGTPYSALERETGVKRSSIQRFVDGRQSIRLDMADRLAAYFRLSLTADAKTERRKSDS